ncbi:hypothetical protein DFH09DRAFT_1092897 [Mycena vulgaris]|nr:hypothetical protein DFH09DRAFT_1092897 [Mycena vulgaris]
MAKKRKMTTTYTLNRDPDEEPEVDGDGVEGNGIGSGSRTTELIREASHVRPDGSVRHTSSVLNVASAAPVPQGSMLRPDVRKAEEEDGPVYDTFEDDEEGRPLRESELLRLDGRGDHRSYSICRDCAVGKADHRCRDCLGGGELLCSACILKRHKQLHFHRIQEWTGVLFKRKTLRALGLRLQLGHWHERDHTCPNPSPSQGDAFVVINDHGVHEIALDYCGCASSGTPTVQLLRAGLYPATTTNPRSAATINVLRRFHLLAFESKCSAYEFYYSLARETDNTGLVDLKDRYHEFLRMTREWRHLQMLKRTARGHDPLGVVNTQDGECALLCPACPHPGKNLPPDWKDYPEEKQFLSALFLAMDANFRLKRKDVSTEQKDPGLSHGWAFFCEVKAYMAHVKEHWGQVQETEELTKILREVTVWRTMQWTSSTAKRVGLHRQESLGERYLNMDYMFFMSVVGTELVRLFVSYDIACQWHVNIWIRMTGYKNEALVLDGVEYMMFLVPKFHLPAQIEACNLHFSFNLTRYVGWTDGEAPERGWANTNPLASSTKEMGPGSRRDTLNDHFNDWNYKKIIGLDLEAAFEDDTLVEWRKMAEAWEKDGDMQNPFASAKKDQHLAAVRRALAEEAAAREAAGIEVLGAVREDMHVTELIAMGLQLEEQQRVLRFDMSGTGLHPTEKQRTAMVERTSKLRRKIFAWTDIQRLFFPIVETLRKKEDEGRARTAGSQPVPGVKVYEITLWLPSGLKRRAGGASTEDGCTVEILTCEYRLRVGQANEALHDIRRHLLVRTHLYALKDRYARGVKSNTRSKTKIDVVEEWIRRAAAQYRDAWAALGVLGKRLGRQEWAATLKELAADDVRGMPRKEQHDAARQAGVPRGAVARAVERLLLEASKKGKRRGGRRSGRGEATGAMATARGKKRKIVRPMSWIWLAQVESRKEGEPEQEDEALRIEWAKTRARSLRWSEEVDLLEEEVRRIAQFLRWRSEWWQEQVGKRGLEEGPQAEGETAYAMRQAGLQADLSTRFTGMWSALPELISAGRAGIIAGDAEGSEGGEDGEEEELEGEGEADEEEEEEAEAAEDSSDENEPIQELGVAGRCAGCRVRCRLDLGYIRDGPVFFLYFLLYFTCLPLLVVAGDVKHRLGVIA